VKILRSLSMEAKMRKLLVPVIGIALGCIAMIAALAQVIYQGADYNKRDRKEATREAELQRLMKIDPPLQDDLLGNTGISALGAGMVGGATGGVAVGLGKAAKSMATGTSRKVIVEKAKEESQDADLYKRRKESHLPDRSQVEINQSTGVSSRGAK
jgi:hypothetical protein